MKTLSCQNGLLVNISLWKNDYSTKPNNEGMNFPAYVDARLRGRGLLIEKLRVIGLSDFSVRFPIFPRQLTRAMKLTAIILFLFSLHVAARGYSQTLTLSIKDAPLGQALRAIQLHSGYTFAYTAEDVQGLKTTFQVKDANIDETLKACLKDLPLTYTIEDRIISLKRAAITVETSTPTPITVTGKIFNEKGEPLVGATVVVKGKGGEVAITDEKGEFTLKDVDPSAVLEVTHIGYERQVFKVNGKSTMTISMKAFITKLADVSVVFNNGYQKINPEKATGSYEMIDNKLFDREVSTDVISRLDGIASSVLFDKRLGSNTTLTIRGISTLFSDMTPLVILDNFPYDGDINNINPNDVENITILKDAAAASQWGTRAGNGVIVITTKKGKYGSPLRVEVNANCTIQGKPNLFYNRNFVDANDFINVEQYLFSQGFYDGNIADPSAPPTSPVVDILAAQRNGTITAAQANSEINAYRGLDIRNDLKKYFYQSSKAQQYNVNLNGGTSQASYFLSVGYDKNNSSQVGDLSDRVTINSYTTYRPIKNLEVIGNFIYTQTNGTGDGTLGEISTGGPYVGSIYPYAQLADSKGNPLSIVKDHNTAFVEAAPGNGFLNWQFYPLQELRQGLNASSSKTIDTRLNGGLRYTVIPGLNAEVNYQYESATGNSSYLHDQRSYYTRNLINEFSNFSGNQFQSYNIPVGDIIELGSNTMISQDGRGQLNYSKNWNRNEFFMLAGAEIRETKNDGQSNMLYGYSHDLGSSQFVDYVSSFPLYPIGSGSIPYGAQITGTVNRFTSLYANGYYTYNGKYTISASARKDASNLFGVNANQKGTPLYSGGIGWDLSKEAFYHLDFLPGLKLRVTYGNSGLVNTSIAAITTISYAPYGAALTNFNFASINNPPNPNLSWERVSQTNFGVDFATRKQILTGTIEYYHKLSTNLIAPTYLDPTAGVFAIYKNSADLKGNGVDLKLHTNNLPGKFKWETDVLFTYYKNIVTKYLGYSNAIPVASQYVGTPVEPSPKVGKVLEAVYAYKWAGLDPNTGDPLGYLQKSTSKDYVGIFNDSISNLVYKGSAIPLYFGSVRNTFTWKNFSLSANITFKFDYWFQKPTINYYTFFSAWGGNSDFLNRWQNPGDEKKTTVPSMDFPADQNRDNFYANAEPNFLRADNIRLQDIRLGYLLDKKSKYIGFTTLQFYVYASNLGIIWRANNQRLDPDYATGYYPPQKSFSFGIKGNF